VAGIGLILTASAASALPFTPLVGSISFSGDFDTLPTPPAASIVSGLTSFDVQDEAQVFAPTGDFAGTPSPAAAADFDLTSPTADLFSTSNGSRKS
jgi:hypothetical protein